MIAGTVIVNDAAALSKLPSDPVAVTVYAVEDAVPEILTVQLKPPVEFTVAPHSSIVAPLVMPVVTVWPGVNPVPDTKTDTPLGPWVGETASVGVVIVNGAVPLSKLPSEPLAVIV